MPARAGGEIPPQKSCGLRECIQLSIRAWLSLTTRVPKYSGLYTVMLGQPPGNHVFLHFLRGERIGLYSSFRPNY